MSFKRITEYINEKSTTQIDSRLIPQSQTVLDFGVNTTNKADELLSSFSIDVDAFSGIVKILLQDGRDDLELPPDLKQAETLSEQDGLVEEFIGELMSSETLIIKLESESVGGIFKWLPVHERLLLISLYKVDPNRQKRLNLPDSAYSLHLARAGNRDKTSYRKSMVKLLYSTLMEMLLNQKEEFDTAYRRFLDYSFQPFETFLYNERLSIKNPKYRPSCQYTKREGPDDRAYLEVQDPPRQITEGGNSVVPVAESRRKFYLSARVNDFDEFDRILILDEKFKVNDWPDKGVLYLEGDLHSNLRKWNAIRTLKNRGLPSHARLADVLIRPWGLRHVIPNARTYFNPGISHDLSYSQPQAHAVDIALSSPDVTLIHGPPGTGKTTVIVEIIRHVIANGGRVIMCAPTHVAVDNVLERTADIKGISAVRVGGRAYMERHLQKYRLQEKASSIELALPSLHKAKNPDTPLYSLQSEFIDQMEGKGRRHMENLAIHQANLVCGTTIGIARFEPPADNPIDFDVMIMDEASKATLMEFLVPAVRAKRWVLVGDHRQLPPYVNEQEIRIYVQRYFEEMDKDVDIDDSDLDSLSDEPTIYDDRTNNLIASLRRFHEEMHAMGEGEVDFHWKRIIDLFNFARKPIKSIEEMVNFALGSCFHYFLKGLDESRNARLVVQHRMPKILADFLDESIYKGNLKTSESAATHGLTLPAVPSIGLGSINNPLTFISTEMLNNNHETPGKYKGFSNKSEAELIAEIVSSLASMDVEGLGYTEDNPFTIGIITYYVGQSREINYKLRTIEEISRDRGWRYYVPNKPIRIRVSIVDRFQGQEQDIVILSLTRSNNRGNIGFLKNLQRINVSLSRAKQNLLIVGNADFFSRLRIKPAPILKQLAVYCQKNRLVKLAIGEDDL